LSSQITPESSGTEPQSKPASVGERWHGGPADLGRSDFVTAQFQYETLALDALVAFEAFESGLLVGSGHAFMLPSILRRVRAQVESETSVIHDYLVVRGLFGPFLLILQVGHLGAVEEISGEAGKRLAPVFLELVAIKAPHGSSVTQAKDALAFVGDETHIATISLLAVAKQEMGRDGVGQ
jgi:hypothetical protein